MQAINMYFDIKMADQAKWKLSDLDWDILDGVEAVLRVSSFLDAGQMLTIVMTDPSHFSTKHVIRGNTSLIACHYLL
jgi:hypothetical protein